jgi:hypothetical protein
MASFGGRADAWKLCIAKVLGGDVRTGNSKRMKLVVERDGRLG